MLSASPLGPWAESAGAVCCWLNGLPGDPGELAERILSPGEQAYWLAMRAIGQRRREWLLGRYTAKEAVRHLLDIRAPLSAIEIMPDSFGRPVAAGPWDDGAAPVVSIAHSDGAAASLAALDPALAGIDLERLRHPRQDYAAVAFSAEERDWIEGLEEPLRDEWALRLWCAKETAGKSLGHGLRGEPLEFHLTGADINTGVMHIECPPLRRGPLAVHTARESDFVFAALIHHD